MNKFYVVAGHNVQSPGALACNGKYEHYYTADLQGLIANHCSKDDVEVAKDCETFAVSDTVRWINNTSKPGDMVIDIHFNHNHPTASGTEVFVHPNTSDSNKQIADTIVASISEVLDIPVRQYSSDRLHKHPSESALGSLAMIENTIRPTILIEVCFLNSHDLNSYKGKENLVAKAIIEAYEIKKETTPI